MIAADMIIRGLGIISFVYIIYGIWETTKNDDPLLKNSFLENIEQSLILSFKYLAEKSKNLFRRQ